MFNLCIVLTPYYLAKMSTQLNFFYQIQKSFIHYSYSVSVILIWQFLSLSYSGCFLIGIDFPPLYDQWVFFLKMLGVSLKRNVFEGHLGLPIKWEIYRTMMTGIKKYITVAFIFISHMVTYYLMFNMIKTTYAQHI